MSLQRRPRRRAAARRSQDGAVLPRLASPARSAAGAGITGTVKDFWGFPASGTLVTWWVPNGAGGWVKGSTATDPDGLYAFSAVPATTGSGEIWLAREPKAAAWQLGRYGMTWADGSNNVFDWQPGSVSFSILRGGPWQVWKYAYAYVWTDPADGNGSGAAYMRAADTYSRDDEGWNGSMQVLPGSGDGAVVYFWMNEGVEVPFAGVVEAGANSATSIVASEDVATRMNTMQSYWDSGKPGKRLILELQHLPTASIWQLKGRSDYPANGAWTGLGKFTAPVSAVNRTVTIPKSAKPGYFYWIALDHVNGLGALSLQVPFQVCTLKASSASVARGSSVRLSGIVPVDGHWGAKRGTPKTVVLYKGPNSQPQPRTWEPSRNNYTKVGSFRTDGYGRFRTSAVRVNGTTTFIVRYPGDATYWRGYTTPVLVKVH